jgi:thioredoxin reductase
MKHSDANSTIWDAIIVGGGPAGLSAALFLGRCRRKVLLFDDGRPRNAPSRAAHGFFTRDGIEPAELLRIGRQQLAQYDVQIHEETVTQVAKHASYFEITTAARRQRARKLLLATGIADEVPAIDGVQELFGRSVFTCPLCDGWEVRDRALAVYGKGSAGVELALSMTTWSDDVLLCTGGTGAVSDREMRELEAHAIPVRDDAILRLDGEAGQLRRIVFAGGDSVQRDALFFCAGTQPRSPLVAQLDCDVDARGKVKTGSFEETAVSGLYVVGDASEDVNFIAVAVAEGTKAACAVNRALRQEDSRARVARFQRRMREVHAR